MSARNSWMTQTAHAKKHRAITTRTGRGSHVPGASSAPRACAALHSQGARLTLLYRLKTTLQAYQRKKYDARRGYASQERKRGAALCQSHISAVPSPPIWET